MRKSHDESSKSNREGNDVEEGDHADWTGPAGEHNVPDDDEDNGHNSLLIKLLISGHVKGNWIW